MNIYRFKIDPCCTNRWHIRHTAVQGGLPVASAGRASRRRRPRRLLTFKRLLPYSLPRRRARHTRHTRQTCHTRHTRHTRQTCHTRQNRLLSYSITRSRVRTDACMDCSRLMYLERSTGGWRATVFVLNVFLTLLLYSLVSSFKNGLFLLFTWKVKDNITYLQLVVELSLWVLFC